MLDPTPVSGTAEGAELLHNGQTTAGSIAIAAAWIPIIGSKISKGVKLAAKAAKLNHVELQATIDALKDIRAEALRTGNTSRAALAEDAIKATESELQKKLHGGRHGDMKGPTGDALESHHMPAASVNGLESRDLGPAIQMDPRDHALTASNGRMRTSCPLNELFLPVQLLLSEENEAGSDVRSAVEIGQCHRLIGELRE